MQITVKDEGTIRTICLSGRMDTVTAPELEAAIESGSDNIQSLVLDMSDLTYTSSAGLRVLLRAQKKMQARGGVKLLHVQPDVMDILEMTGFDTILTIE